MKGMQMIARRRWWIGRTGIIAAMVLGLGLTGCGGSDDEPGIGDVVESPGDPGGEGDVLLTPASENDPHLPDSPGPWFEGWYTRVTDAGGIEGLYIKVLRGGEVIQLGPVGRKP